MFDEFFGSKIRYTVLIFFFNNSDTMFSVVEIAKAVRSTNITLNKELKSLVTFGIIKQFKQLKRVGYKLEKDFVLYNEIKNLLLRMQISIVEKFFDKMRAGQRIDFVALTGQFLDVQDTSVDVLIVGSINKEKAKQIVSKLELVLDKVVRYAVLNKSAFQYRKTIADKFICDILNNQNVVLGDKIY